MAGGIGLPNDGINRIDQELVIAFAFFEGCLGLKPLTDINDGCAQAHFPKDTIPLAAQGDHEVSFYGTDGIAEILYDLTFEIPVTVKNIYDDSIGKKFHTFKVLPVEDCRTAKEKLIITSLVGIDERIRRLKTLGVSLDRIVVLQ